MRQKRTQMMLVKYFCAAALLVMLTIWLQCGGIAALIRWIRSVMEDNVDQLGFFHVAGLVVRFAIAVIVLHVVEVSLWGKFLPLVLLAVMGNSILLLSGQLCNRWLWRRKPPVELADVWAAGEHHRRINVRNFRERVIRDSHAARQPQYTVLTQVNRPR